MPHRRGAPRLQKSENGWVLRCWRAKQGKELRGVVLRRRNKFFAYMFGHFQTSTKRYGGRRSHADSLPLLERDEFSSSEDDEGRGFHIIEICTGTALPFQSRTSSCAQNMVKHIFDHFVHSANLLNTARSRYTERLPWTGSCPSRRPRGHSESPMTTFTSRWDSYWRFWGCSMNVLFLQWSPLVRATDKSSFWLLRSFFAWYQSV